MKLKSKNIKRIHIVAGAGDEPTKVVLEVFEPPKKKKLTSTWFPTLYGANSFTMRGDEVLRFYGLLESDPFDNFYTLRGAIAERLVRQMLEKKGYSYKIFKDNFDAFQYTKEGDNVLYKYFGGLPDIVYQKDGEDVLLEVKSKDAEKKEWLEKRPPETEILQGKMLALLWGLDKVSMTYVLFGDKVARMMYLSLPEPFDLDVAIKNFDEKMPTLKYKEDYEIIVKEYTINKYELLQQMKEAYKYADGFRQTLSLNYNDLSPAIRQEILDLEKELEKDFK